MNTIDHINETPAFKRLWAYASGLIAYTTITKMHYQGAINGSEFLTYNAGKLYIANFVRFGGSSNNAAACSINFYDTANAVNYVSANDSMSWDTTAAAFKYFPNTLLVECIFFSRFVQSNYSYFVFNGYKLTV